MRRGAEGARRDHRRVTIPSAAGIEDDPRVIAVHRSGSYTFSKDTVGSITLVAGLGVEGDVHAGGTVRHRSRVARDPTQPNLRQVHLVATETLAALADQGFDVGPGAIGENITTAGIDLFGLPTGALLRLGPDALVAITGLRHPCRQLDGLAAGLMSALVDRDASGDGRYRAGVMGVVVQGGVVPAGAPITVGLPPEPRLPLARV
jgi:MOSC domain-containing protein YiiM